ncbi:MULTISPECIES: spore coat protein U domain-containing protein [Roseomonadaceae]|uniref:Spore coat protein U domain-containing protein n=1 Tax=Falsiroseomonas oleicola TaxID=2801474 RepID=A0ABS6HAF4_9PROT|nr:spore coat protein U domain-containing protein [Roseomonas oleicola]MBU8545384.1 spore coat protein U domain-containing protein [Roseomonas oleicola]
MKRLLLSMTCLGFTALALPAFAQTATGTMAVAADVTAVCTISATSLTFAGYSQTVDTDTTATATGQCTGTSGTLNFTVGEGANYADGSRQVTDGTNFLTYQVAESVGGADLVVADLVDIEISPELGAGSTTLYGRIPAGQGNRPAGAYVDSVVLTINW